MELIYRKGVKNDDTKIKLLAINSWSQYKERLSEDNWEQLETNLNNIQLYQELLQNSASFICENKNKEIVGMAFLVPSGNPTEIFKKEWSYIRFVTVDGDYAGKGIGQKLTQMCIDKAKTDKESIIALHTSEIMENARHIYSKMGFEILKELPKRLGLKYWIYILKINEYERNN